MSYKKTTPESTPSDIGTIVTTRKRQKHQVQNYIADLLSELQMIAKAEGLDDLAKMIGITHIAATASPEDEGHETGL